MANKLYPVELKLDCTELEASEVRQLASKIVCATEGRLDTQIIGGDTLYIEGCLTEFAYNHIWRIIDGYNVKSI